MSYEIRDKLSLKLLFNDEEFIFRRANSLNFLHMCASTKVAVPMLHLSLQDNLDSLSTFSNLGDGAKIQVVLANGQGPSSTYIFRLNSSHRQPLEGGYMYDIDAYLDVPTFWNASPTEPLRGTSYKTIETIAKNCGLGFSGDQTADSQIWLPRNMQYHAWAKEICNHGYRSDFSCMQLGLDLDKTLNYKDLSESRKRTKLFNFGEYRSGSVLVTDIQPMVASGSMNHLSGYADMLVEQDLSREDINRVTNSVSINKSLGEKALLVNSRVKGVVPLSRVNFTPISAGNTHSEYERAFYQNTRINNLHSSRISLVTPDNTNVRLLDRVSLTLDETTTYLAAYSGDYIVGSRTIYVKGNTYFEKLELLRRSMNTEVKDSL
jgi:hypothetical protein